MKLLRITCVSLAIVIGFITIVASGPTGGIMVCKDNDGDGYGDPNDSILSDGVPDSGWVLDNRDCDDTNASVYPGAIEVCNNLTDDNCNGVVDEDYSDVCGDGYGFSDLGNGTVRDDHTGLIWLRNANVFVRISWLDAMDEVAFVRDGHPFSLKDGSSAGDWRLPTLQEFREMMDTNFVGPAISNADGDSQWIEGDPFVGVQYDCPLYEGCYWTSSTWHDPYCRCYVEICRQCFDNYHANTNYGVIYTSYWQDDAINYVWPVRDPRPGE